MKKVFAATKLHHTESFVHEESVSDTQVQRRSVRKCVCRHHAQVRIETGVPSDPPTDSEIDPCEGADWYDSPPPRGQNRGAGCIISSSIP